MADNQATFNEASGSVLPGKEGVRHDGALFKEAKWANKNSADLLNRWGAGQSGVRHDGDLYGMLRRTEHNTAVTAQLVAALQAVAGGEAFDEAKLLAGIDKTVRDAMADTVKVEVSVEGAK